MSPEIDPGQTRFNERLGPTVPFRGGISVALALSLPPGRERDVILAITYAVVVFSIVIQGLTLQKMVRWTMLRHAPQAVR